MMLMRGKKKKEKKVDLRTDGVVATSPVLPLCSPN